MSVSKPSVLFWLCLFVVASVALLRPHPGAALPYAGAALSSGADKAGTLQHVAGGDVPMPVNVPAAHASTLVALGNAHPASLAAFWFAGTRESAADVQIALSTFDRKDRRWTAARFVVDRHLLGQAPRSGQLVPPDPLVRRPGRARRSPRAASGPTDRGAVRRTARRSARWPPRRRALRPRITSGSR